MTIKHIDIANISGCIEILKTVQSRKHSTIKYYEYEKLERIFVDSYFEAHAEIDRKKWSSWAITNILKALLSDQLKSLGIVRLPHPVQASPHNFISNKHGLAKIVAIENKIKLNKKLKAKQIK